jgi:hypothetical protein
VLRFRDPAETEGNGKICTFQAVTLNILPALPVLTVCLAMPGGIAIGPCRRLSKVRCPST